MIRPAFTPHILKTAWKVVETVFDHYEVTEGDADALLLAATVLGLADVSASGGVSWKSPPAADRVPVFQDRGTVSLRRTQGRRFQVRKHYSDETVDRAYDESEALFDRYELPDDERASLYSALPCLGLSVLGQHLEWTAPPPFL